MALSLGLLGVAGWRRASLPRWLAPPASRRR
jgi:hypothetical protein